MRDQQIMLLDLVVVGSSDGSDIDLHHFQAQILLNTLFRSMAHVIKHIKLQQ